MYASVISWPFATKQGSCPTDVFYDLGPAQTVKNLRTFQLTGHQFYEGGPPNKILLYKKFKEVSGRHVKEAVKEIPSAVLKVLGGMSTSEPLGC